MPDVYSYGTIRYLPVFLLIDASDSMNELMPADDGERSISVIDAVRNGLDAMKRFILGYDEITEIVRIKLITFNSIVTKTEMRSIKELSVAPITAKGMTGFGAALKALDHDASFQGDLIKNTPDRKGTYKPIVFIFTDGCPSDDYTAIAHKIKRRVVGGELTCTAFACGPKSDRSVLKLVTDDVRRVEQLTPTSMRQMFQLVTQSIKIGTIHPQDPKEPKMSDVQPPIYNSREEDDPLPVSPPQQPKKTVLPPAREL